MYKAEFNEFVKQNSRKLYGHAFRILRNQEEAEDAVQETFIKLWRMADKLKQYSSVEALAITITKNFCIDQLRKTKRVDQNELTEGSYRDQTFPSPLDQMEVRESNEIIHSIIEKLPESYRLLVRMRDIEGLSYDEIAVKSDQNINTIRVTLSRARKMIRDEYNKNQYERRRG